MTKPKTIVRCQACGYVSPKWMGRCPDCGEWNTMVDEVEEPGSGFSWKSSGAAQRIGEVEANVDGRLSTGLAEFDRVLGGGVVPGSVMLLGGEPGIGKSTLLLQVSNNLAQSAGPVLLVSGEESAAQIKLRASRLGALAGELYLLAGVDLGEITKQVERLSPSLLVIDSIQTMFDADVPGVPGSVTQVRESTLRLMRLAKERGTPVFVIGHVTKDGAIAGPRLLEHIVDTVLYFEGEARQAHRIIRGVKNRFGATNEVAVFEMTASGLVEVENPSALFMGEQAEARPGSVALAAVEGTRPILLELQALVTDSSLAVPRRVAFGLDYNRVCLTVAVLTRRAGLSLAQQDIYVSVAGGMRATEPAADLAVAVAVASAHRDRDVPAGTVVFGEVGLGGEVRPVAHLERRLKEASKFGQRRAIIPAQDACLDGLDVEPLRVRTVREALDLVG